ncbi:hypothetical protein [Paraburkholderia sp. DHOC27]|uniref:hypothetical protein n=1 Tax=Paraburkholderia sp. DHOC27 TaxID=2303330 RepID=UPI000E3CCD0D|nr:hypothetical protein [Paraburkholderia sp. DHOC27]RFU45617.1 hypothetical protein D0B32_23805 [Paraburkholderia sp. DHOC27]
MKMKISMYWPLAVFVPLAAAACLYVGSETASRIAQPPLGADQLSAELARAVSYGLVDGNAAMPVKHVHGVATMSAAEVS